MNVIFKKLENRVDETLKEELKRVVHRMGVKAVILGCTELPLII